MWLLVKRRFPCFLYLLFKYWSTVRSPLSVFSRIKRPRFFSLSSWGGFSSTLIPFMALLLTLSNLSFFEHGDQNWTQYSSAAWRCAPNWGTMPHWADQGRVKFWRIKGEYCLSHKLFCEFMQHSGIWEIKLTGCYGPDIFNVFSDRLQS